MNINGRHVGGHYVTRAACALCICSSKALAALALHSQIATGLL